MVTAVVTAASSGANTYIVVVTIEGAMIIVVRAVVAGVALVLLYLHVVVAVAHLW